MSSTARPLTSCAPPSGARRRLVSLAALLAFAAACEEPGRPPSSIDPETEPDAPAASGPPSLPPRPAPAEAPAPAPGPGGSKDAAAPAEPAASAPVDAAGTASTVDARSADATRPDSGGFVMPGPEGVFTESQAGLRVEIEAARPTGQWTMHQTFPNHYGTGYYTWRNGDDSTRLDPAGRGVLSYRVRITTPGTYQLTMRSRKGDGASDQHNDVFIRIVGAVLRTPDFEIGDGRWIKFYQGGADWRVGGTIDAPQGHGPAIVTLAAREYRVEFSGRSSKFSIDGWRLTRWVPPPPRPDAGPPDAGASDAGPAPPVDAGP